MRAFPDLAALAEARNRPLRAIGRVQAAAVLIVLAALLAISAIRAPAPEPEPAADASAEQSEESGDIALYYRIANRVADGENYYAAATDEHRTHNYPVRPFVTIRPPTLAHLHAAIGDTGLRWLGIGLLLAIVLAWERTLEARANLAERAGACVLLFLAGFGAFDARNLMLHELLAGLLLTLSLGLYRPHRWWPSLLAAAAALAVRELAVHVVLLWLAIALSARRWREAAALAALLALFAIAMVAHYLAVSAVTVPDDPVSQGWSGFMGLSFALDGLVRFSALTLLPAWLGPPLALLPLLGFAALGGRLGLFAILWGAGLLLGVALFAREDNFYWMLMILPAWAAGLAFVTRALFDLIGALVNPVTPS